MYYTYLSIRRLFIFPLLYVSSLSVDSSCLRTPPTAAAPRVQRPDGTAPMPALPPLPHACFGSGVAALGTPALKPSASRCGACAPPRCPGGSPFPRSGSGEATLGTTDL